MSGCELSELIRSAEVWPLTGNSTAWSIAIRRKYCEGLHVEVTVNVEKGEMGREVGKSGGLSEV